MRQSAPVIFFALLLTACGGGGKSDLVKACLDEGESRESCECMAEEMEAGLSPRAFEAMVLSATGKDEQAEAAMDELGMTEGLSIAGVMLKVVSQCDIRSFGP